MKYDLFAFVHLALVTLMVIAFGWLIVLVQDMNQLRNMEVICFEDHSCRIEHK